MKKSYIVIGIIVLVVIGMFGSCFGKDEKPDSDVVTTTETSEFTTELTDAISEDDESTSLVIETTTEEIVTEATTEKATQKPTEKVTQKPTEKETEKRTENQTKSNGRTVYITDQGERYHFDPDCPGKNGYGVSINEVGSRTACKKCAQ